MKHPSTWTKSDLFKHLQHAIDLELWTIPLYLTALYSIRDLNKLKHQDYPDAAKLLFSVVIQEMLHLELVCNIANALGYSPRFRTPCYDEKKGIPFIHPSMEYLPPNLHGYKVTPQALNEHSLRLFCAIELPHPKKELLWEKEKSYGCIANLYEALKTAITHSWDDYYVGHERNTKQKNTFLEYHNMHGKKHGFSQHVHSIDTALKAIDAIIEQGEGADSHHVPADFCPEPPAEGMEYDISWYKGHLSHYQKFRVLLHSYHKLPLVYEASNGVTNAVVQLELEKSFAGFLSEMEHHFNNHGDVLPDTFWKKMFALGGAITSVWQAGNCPHFSPDSISQPAS